MSKRNYKFDSETFREIRELEQRQIRSMADLHLDPDDAEAKHQLRERRAKIAALRETLSTKRVITDDELATGTDARSKDDARDAGKLNDSGSQVVDDRAPLGPVDVLDSGR